LRTGRLPRGQEKWPRTDGQPGLRRGECIQQCASMMKWRHGAREAVDPRHTSIEPNVC